MTLDSKPNFLDRVIGFFSPGAYLHRMRCRIANEILSRGYEGASLGTRNKNWRPSNSDADVEVQTSLSMLRARSRDLVRNNSYARRGVESIVNNTIGTGILLKVSDAGLNENWKAWADSTDCDFYGEMNFYAIQRLVTAAMVESGDVIIKRIRTGDVKNPVKIQVLEGDYLDTTKYDSDNNIRSGIEFSKEGKILAYWLFKEHPGGRKLNFKSDYTSERVPASEAKLIFREDRPGQIRGVPWTATVMNRLKDYKDYEEAQLIRQKIAACFVGFIETNEDPINQTTSSSEPTKPMSDRFTPGQWEVLPPGKRIVFGNPPGTGADYEPYSKRQLLSVAAGMGITYECLTSDYGNVNFSSGRMGWLEMWRNIEAWRWQIIIPKLCDIVFEWWIEGQAVVSGISYEDLGKTWTPPRREMIDPTKEVAAMRDSIRAGLSTFSDSVRQLGYDPEEHFDEYASDIKRLDQLNLVLESDYRKEIQGKNGNTDTGN